MPPRYIAVPFSGSGVVGVIVPPTLTAAAESASEIDLALSYSGPPNAITFAFETSSSASGPFVPIASQSTSTLQYIGLSQNTQYFFRGKVQVSDGRFSDYSNIASAQTFAVAPSQVQNLTATGTGTTTSTLTWDPTPQAGTYQIFRNGVQIDRGIVPTSYNDSGLAPGTTYTYTVAASNSVGTGPQSAPDTATTFIQTSGSSVTKFNPGFYAAFNTPSYGGAITLATTFLKRTDIANVRGIQIYFRVNEVMTAAGGSVTNTAPYTTFFTNVDNLLKLCAAAGKQLAIGLWDRGFGTGDGTSNGGAFPPFMNGGTKGGGQGSNNYVTWAANGASFGGVDSILNWGNATLMAEIENWCKATGARYNSHPNFECLNPIGETSFSPGIPSATSFYNGIQALFPAIKSAWPNTLLRLQGNFVPGGSPGGNNAANDWIGMIRSTSGCAMGGPDPIGTPGFTTTVATLFTGTTSGSTVSTNGDLRGKACWWSEVQEHGLGGSQTLFPGGSGTGATLGATTATAMIAAQKAQGAQYFTVDAADNSDAVQFNRDVLPAINAVSGQLNASLPTDFVSSSSTPPSQVLGLELLFQGQTSANQGSFDSANESFDPQDGDTQVLQWTPAVPGSNQVLQYQINRASVGGTPTFYDVSNTTSYTDVNATQCVSGTLGTTAPHFASNAYVYSVQAIDSTGTKGTASSGMKLVFYANGVSKAAGGDFDPGSGITTNYSSTSGNPAGGHTQCLQCTMNSDFGVWNPFFGNNVTQWNCWLGAFTKLQFDINPAFSTAASNFTIHALRRGGPSGDTDLLNQQGTNLTVNLGSYVASLPANTWTTVQVPLVDYLTDWTSGHPVVEYAGYKMDFQLNIPKTTPAQVYYIDNVMYV